MNCNKVRAIHIKHLITIAIGKYTGVVVSISRFTLDL